MIDLSDSPFPFTMNTTNEERRILQYLDSISLTSEKEQVDVTVGLAGRTANQHRCRDAVERLKTAGLVEASIKEVVRDGRTSLQFWMKLSRQGEEALAEARASHKRRTWSRIRLVFEILLFLMVLSIWLHIFG